VISMWECFSSMRLRSSRGIEGVKFPTEVLLLAGLKLSNGWADSRLLQSLDIEMANLDR